MKYDYLIAGAGFAGITTARLIADVLNKKVLIVDLRNHVAGNAYDYTDENGILVHKYGPHIFHTNDEKVFNFLSQFTGWYKYEHSVVSRYEVSDYPIPVNMVTLNKLYSLNLTNAEETKKYLDSVTSGIGNPKNSEDVMLARVGRDLYGKFFERFTEKIWFEHPSKLAPNVCGRINVRYDDDCRYFTDEYQFLPDKGYTKLAEKMLAHKNIDVELETDFKAVNKNTYSKLVYTGPIDAFFDYIHGKLPYRSIEMIFENHKEEFYQNHAVVNFPGDEPYYRITEYKRITGGKSDSTTICKEFAAIDGERFYPKRTIDALELFDKYKKDAKKLKGIFFAGMHPYFQYYDIGQVVAQCLRSIRKPA